MASHNNMPRIVELAAQISTSVSELQQGLTAQGATSLSKAEGSPESVPADVFDLRDAVLDASAELHELLLEPLILIFKLASISNLVNIDAISRYHIPDMIPPGGQISFEDTAIWLSVLVASTPDAKPSSIPTELPEDKPPDACVGGQ